MTVQLVRFGVGELAGAWSTAAWTGLTFGSIREDSESRHNEELPTAGGRRSSCGASGGTYEGWDGASGSPARRRGDACAGRVIVESWTNWLSAEEPGSMFLRGVRPSLRPLVPHRPRCCSSADDAPSPSPAPPPPPSPCDLSPTPQMCLFMCSAK